MLLRKSGYYQTQIITGKLAVVAVGAAATLMLLQAQLRIECGGGEGERSSASGSCLLVIGNGVSAEVHEVIK